jgi:hypothetical protein
MLTRNRDDSLIKVPDANRFFPRLLMMMMLVRRRMMMMMKIMVTECAQHSDDGSTQMCDCILWFREVKDADAEQ